MNIAIVGEALSEADEETGRPFSGPAGWHLDAMLSAAGISRRDCLVTNVFNLRPPRNDVKFLCGPKTQGVPSLPPLMRGKYLLRQHEAQLTRLYAEIESANPNLILALGATATWAFTGLIGIRTVRGMLAQGNAACGHRKVLPTYHPSAVTRQWTLRPIVVADFEKAARLSADPTFSRPSRKIWIEPTLDDLRLYEETELAGATKLACDIETKQDQITCIGFAPRADSAIVIPFFKHSGANYWQTQEEEVAAWEYVARWLRDYPTVFQNGLYDMGFLWRVYGIPTPRAVDDTMLLHHALQPEMEKGLGFLASLYTDEASWKFMIKGMAHD